VHFLIYAAVRLALLVLQILNVRNTGALGRRIGAAARLLDRRHVRILRKNLARVETTFRPSDPRGFEVGVFESLGLTLAELAMVPRQLSRVHPRIDVSLERFDRLDAALVEGKGAILAVGHTGNYEMAGLAVALAGYPLHSLARPIVNSRLGRYLTDLRGRTGQRLIPPQGALPAMMDVLRRNEVLVVEIDVDAKAAGLLLEFFGVPASTQRGPAVLALRRGAPVFVADVHREGNKTRCILSRPVRPETFFGLPDPVAAMSGRISEEFERVVRAHPKQWWWILDRWRGAEKRLRAGSDSAGGF
jgi:KDO2-lipid IV(A) lauroyltransferase